MSYVTQFRMVWYNGGLNQARKDDRDRVLAAVAEYVGAVGYASDIVTLQKMFSERRAERAGSDGVSNLGEWADEFRAAVSNQEADFEYMEEEWATGLLRFLSGRFPGAVFGARGVGEDLSDVWVVWVRDGEVLAGPPAEERHA